MRARRVYGEGDSGRLSMLLQNLRRPGIRCVVGDPGAIVPVSQVIAGGCLG